jgi:hypothetical protein
VDFADIFDAFCQTVTIFSAFPDEFNATKIEDKSILTVYAKSLAKLGKYHEADLVFYSLGEKNQLDNDGRLDYSRTLLIAGHYVSTKQQASKAKGDEAVYLSALASFNQHRWSESEAAFSKVLSYAINPVFFSTCISICSANSVSWS